MYDRMRGPANVRDLLYSGQTDPRTGGSGREEPLVFTVDYGKARIFHIMLGHCGPTLEDNPAMQCAGFQTLLLRGAECHGQGETTRAVGFPDRQIDIAAAQLQSARAIKRGCPTNRGQPNYFRATACGERNDANAVAGLRGARLRPTRLR